MGGVFWSKPSDKVRQARARACERKRESLKVEDDEHHLVAAEVAEPHTTKKGNSMERREDGKRWVALQLCVVPVVVDAVLSASVICRKLKSNLTAQHNFVRLPSPPLPKFLLPYQVREGQRAFGAQDVVH